MFEEDIIKSGMMRAERFKFAQSSPTKDYLKN